MREDFLNEGRLPLVLQPAGEAEVSLGALIAWIEANRGRLRERLNRYGAVLFRDFAIAGPADFHRAAEAVAAPAKLANYAGGDSPRGKVEGQVYNSTDFPPVLEIPPHNEKSYAPDYPRTVMFYCDRPAAEQGETPLVDGRRLLARLAPSLVETFRDKRVTYIQNLYDGSRGGNGVGKSWQQTYETQSREGVERLLAGMGSLWRWRADGGLHVEQTMEAVLDHPATGEPVFFSQADQWHVSHLDPEVRAEQLSREDEFELYHAARFGDSTVMEAALLDEVRAAIRAGKVRFPWQRGDLLVLDNILTLHGREPYRGDRRILVAMA